MGDCGLIIGGVLLAAALLGNRGGNECCPQVCQPACAYDSVYSPYGVGTYASSYDYGTSYGYGGYGGYGYNDHGYGDGYSYTASYSTGYGGYSAGYGGMSMGGGYY